MSKTEQEKEIKQEQTEEQATVENQVFKYEQELESVSAENAKLQAKIKSLEKAVEKSDSYLNQLVAIKNDFENYKRRTKTATEQARAEGIQSVALKLIGIADTFEIAQKHLPDGDTKKAFDMVHQQFLQTLLELGVQQMNVKGQEFDHMTMNALSQLDCGDENKGKVVEVYKNGYTMGEKVIRYAEVIVGA